MGRLEEKKIHLIAKETIGKIGMTLSRVSYNRLDYVSIKSSGFNV